MEVIALQLNMQCLIDSYSVHAFNTIYIEQMSYQENGIQIKKLITWP